ncbi:MAG: zinc transporter ZupT [Clostridiales bacterium]|jgi:ZIP family zinc transporter|nr:zinc transporter ZupT [Clostridiales bacterium]
MFGKEVLVALLLTFLAGFSTVIGSFIGMFAKKSNTGFLSVSLGFSAGVMIYVSMIEIFFKAKDGLSAEFGAKNGTIYTVLAFFAGMLIIAVIDKLLPSQHAEPPLEKDLSPSEADVSKSEFNLLSPTTDRPLRRRGRSKSDLNLLSPEHDKKKAAALLRSGTLTALAIGLHNIPEGLVTFLSALSDPALAMPIVFAIAIHNIPEGIAVSAPIYFSTGSKKKAFLYSFLSGLTEPLGALIGYLIIGRFLNRMIPGLVFAAVAGIMVYISIDELLPSAREYGGHRRTMIGFVAGMIVMAVSLILFL